MGFLNTGASKRPSASPGFALRAATLPGAPGRWRLRRAKPVAVLVLMLTAVAIQAPVAAQVVAEDEVKATYTYQFGKFIEWPSGQFGPAAGTANLCIIGRNPFSPAALRAVEGRQLKGRTLRVQVFDSGLIPTAELDRCPIVFISRSEAGRLGAILSALAPHPILTVSDNDGFLARGGMIALYRVGANVRFDLNLKALRQAGFEVSSKLIELAHTAMIGQEAR